MGLTHHAVLGAGIRVLETLQFQRHGWPNIPGYDDGSESATVQVGIIRLVVEDVDPYRPFCEEPPSLANRIKRAGEPGLAVVLGVDDEAHVRRERQRRGLPWVLRAPWHRPRWGRYARINLPLGWSTS
jgi:hypothetical protein